MVPQPDPKHALYPPWCLIESAPETFQSMAQMYGVRGIEVEEVFSLDDLLTVDRPIYGLIMSYALDMDTLSKESDNMDSDAASLFFSCQVVTNVCATSALLGVLLNIDDNDLVIGDDLQGFKDFTKDFSPVDRGMTIANSSLLQKTHNTFASFESKMDAKQYPQYRDIKATKNMEDDTPDYHFAAFIPAKGYVWELDGYNKVPVKLHKITDNWLEHIVYELKGRMHKSGDVRFNMLAVTKSPENSSTSTATKSSSSSSANAPSSSSLANAPSSSTPSSLLPHQFPSAILSTPPPSSSSSSSSSQDQSSKAAQQKQYLYRQLIYRIEGYLDVICYDWRQHTLEQHQAMDTAQNESALDSLTNSDESIAKLINSTTNRASVISLLKLYEQIRGHIDTSLGTNTMQQPNGWKPYDLPAQPNTFMDDENKAVLRRQHDYDPFIHALFNKLNDEDLLQA